MASVRRPNRNRAVNWRRVAFARMLTSIVLTLGVCALMIAFHGLNDQVFPSDAAVVTSSEVFSDGRLSPGSQGLADVAYGLYYYGTVKKILVSGGTDTSGVNEAEGVRNYLMKHGVDPADTVLDRDGNNIRAKARFTAAYAREHGWERVIAVSQFFHLPRAVLGLKHEGAHVVGILASGYFEARDFFSLPREIPVYFACWSESE